MKPSAVRNRARLASADFSSFQQSTFSRAQRFKFISRQPSDSFYELPSTLSRRACTFGRGRRHQFAKVTDAPPPDSYSLRSCFEAPQRAHSFGASVKVKPPAQVPGPGTYCPAAPLASRGCKFTSRPSSRSRDCTPSPTSYAPSFKLLESNRFTGISFGAKRSKDYVSATPGPGAYDLPSGFSVA